MSIQDSTAVGTPTEIELQVANEEYFFVLASEEASCRLTLEHLVHRSDGALLEFFAVEGTDPDRIVGMARDVSGVAEARLVREAPDGGLVQLIVAGPCVTTTLADAGAVTRAVTARDGTGRVVANVPAHADVRTVVEMFQSRHPRSELLASRRDAGSIPVRSQQGLKGTLAERLTDRQIEVLRAAYLSGYFEWPRESSAEECAESLDISQPTFSQHMRAIHDSMAACLFENSPARTDGARASTQ